jgi:hypothetical protein
LTSNSVTEFDVKNVDIELSSLIACFRDFIT